MLTELEIDLLQRSRDDEEGIGLTSNEREDRAIAKLAKRGLVRIGCALPGAPMAYEITIAGASELP